MIIISLFRQFQHDIQLFNKFVFSLKISLLDDFLDKIVVFLNAVKVFAASKYQSLLDSVYQSIMTLLDITVFIWFARLNAYRLDLVMIGYCLVIVSIFFWIMLWVKDYQNSCFVN